MPKPARSRAALDLADRPAPADEWIGGVITLPTLVHDDDGGAPFAPKALFWMHPGRFALGFELFERDVDLTRAAELFRRTTRKPMAGVPHVPRRLRVVGHELAELLRAALADDGIDVIEQASAPELDFFVDTMAADLGARGLGGVPGDAALEITYLGSGLAAAAVGAFCGAAARLYRAQPWRSVPDDQSFLFVTSEKLGIRDGVVSVIGQGGEHFGFVWFDSLDDADAYVAASEEDWDEHGPSASMPAHAALSFEPLGDVSAGMLRELREHNWPVAGPDAFPMLYRIDERLQPQPPSPQELLRIHVVTAALAELVELQPDFATARFRRRAIEHATTVSTSQGPVNVALSTQDARTKRALEARGRDVEWAPVVDDAGNIRKAALDAQREALMGRLTRVEPPAAGAKRAKARSNKRQALSISELVMHLAADMYGEALVCLQPSQLREIVFGAMATDLALEPATAPAIIAELSALFRMLERDLGSVEATRCLKVLDAPDAVAQLRDALEGDELDVDLDEAEAFLALSSALMSAPPPPKQKSAKPAPKQKAAPQKAQAKARSGAARPKKKH